MQLVLSHCFRFPSMYQCWRLLVVSLRVLLVVLMLPLGCLGITADQFYLKGLKTSDLSYFRLAIKLFPFEKEILVGEADSYINFKILNEKSLISIKNALVYDPYSIRLLSMDLQYDYLLGNKTRAIMNFKKLKNMAPNSSTVKQLTNYGYR